MIHDKVFVKSFCCCSLKSGVEWCAAIFWVESFSYFEYFLRTSGIYQIVGVTLEVMVVAVFVIAIEYESSRLLRICAYWTLLVGLVRLAIFLKVAPGSETEIALGFVFTLVIHLYFTILVLSLAAQIQQE